MAHRIVTGTVARVLALWSDGAGRAADSGVVSRAMKPKTKRTLVITDAVRTTIPPPVVFRLESIPTVTRQTLSEPRIRVRSDRDHWIPPFSPL
jgi:hypothetical protein